MASGGGETTGWGVSWGWAMTVAMAGVGGEVTEHVRLDGRTNRPAPVMRVCLAPAVAARRIWACLVFRRVPSAGQGPRPAALHRASTGHTLVCSTFSYLSLAHLTRAIVSFLALP